MSLEDTLRGLLKEAFSTHTPGLAVKFRMASGQYIWSQRMAAPPPVGATVSYGMDKSDQNWMRQCKYRPGAEGWAEFFDHQDKLITALFRVVAVDYDMGAFYDSDSGSPSDVQFSPTVTVTVEQI
jgi:hypothetical protein